MGIIASSGRMIAVQQLAAEIICRDVRLPPIIILMRAARNHTYSEMRRPPLPLLLLLLLAC